MNRVLQASHLARLRVYDIAKRAQAHLRNWAANGETWSHAPAAYSVQAENDVVGAHLPMQNPDRPSRL
jgi:hypothetical protein